jgi:hypothetical protein
VPAGRIELVVDEFQLAFMREARFVGQAHLDGDGRAFCAVPATRR